jgi:hypothetical protein
MDSTDAKILAFVSAILLLLGLFWYDGTDLHPEVLIAHVVDKQTIVSCPPVNDSNGNWITDVCDDEFKLSLDSADWQTIDVPRSVYQGFANGDLLQMNWDRGRLGFWHNVRYYHPVVN